MDRFTAFSLSLRPARPSGISTPLGLAAGWRCWEVGAGGTSVVTHLAERVGPAGRVLATDINLAWASGVVAPQVEVVEHDVAARPAPGWPL